MVAVARCSGRRPETSPPRPAPETKGLHVVPGEVKHVELELTARGEERAIHPMYDLLANGDCVDSARTTHWNYSGEELGIMHFVRGSLSGFREAVAAMDPVHDHDLTRVDDATFYAYLRCGTYESTRDLFGLLTQGRLVVLHPVEWRPDGTQSLSVMGTPAEIQSVVEDIPDPVECSVREIGGLERAADAVAGTLSDRQREALELGYYDIPREAGVEDVAAEMGCARSTAAEHLRKTESKLLSAAFER